MRASRAFISKGSNYNTSASVETSIAGGPYAPNGAAMEKAVYSDTRPLVAPMKSPTSRGPNTTFMEMSDLERAHRERRESKGGWGINVHTDWNVSSSLKSSSASSSS